jgi:hypothetical protein
MQLVTTGLSLIGGREDIGPGLGGLPLYDLSFGLYLRTVDHNQPREIKYRS